MPIKPKILIKGVDYSHVFMAMHLDRNIENQDADRANIRLSNPYGKLTGKFTKGDKVEAQIDNEIRARKGVKTSGNYHYNFFTGSIHTIQDGPRIIEIIATCKITSLSKVMPNGLTNHQGESVKSWVQFIINEFNAIAKDWERIEVAEIWNSSTVIRKDQMTNIGDITFLDALDLCCDFSGGFYYFDDYNLFHFCDPSKPRQTTNKDIGPVSTNPVACYTQQGYHNVQTVVGSSENEPGHTPAEQDTHYPIMATFEAPTVGEEGRIIAPPIYIPYVTTQAEALAVAKNMVANYAQYKNATQDLELVNAVIKPLDIVNYATGLQYARGFACSKIKNVKHGHTHGMVRRGVTDLSVRGGWRQKLETCAPPNAGSGEGGAAMPTVTPKDTETATIKVYGQPPYAWTKDGVNYYFLEEAKYDAVEVELHDRGETIGDGKIYINPETYNPNADPSTWDVAQVNDNQVPEYGWKQLERWDSSTAVGDVEGNISKFHF